MKKNKVFVCVIATALVMSSGCKKIIDEIIKNPNGVASDCRIERIISDYETVKDTTTFEYDNKGNPLAVRHSIVNNYLESETRLINSYFRYYPDGRLAIFLQEAHEPIVDGKKIYSALFWHKYSYEGNIVTDSAFQYGYGPLEIGFSPEFQTSLPWVSKHELDSYGRIVKTHLYYSEDYVSTTWIYEYDANGNLARTYPYSPDAPLPPQINYSLTKHNIRQTHKTWMFIDANYSVNDAIGETVSYNNKKLPSAFEIMPSVIIFPHSLNREYFTNVKVTYKCK